MATTLKLIPCGSAVTPSPGVEGVVTCIFIRDNYVTYEVTYWINGIQYKCVSEAYELQVSGKLKKQTLGFV